MFYILCKLYKHLQSQNSKNYLETVKFIKITLPRENHISSLVIVSLVHLSMPAHVCTQKHAHIIVHIWVLLHILFSVNTYFFKFPFSKFDSFFPLIFCSFGPPLADPCYKPHGSISTGILMSCSKSDVHMRVLFSHSLFYECEITLYACFFNVLFFSKRSVVLWWIDFYGCMISYDRNVSQSIFLPNGSLFVLGFFHDKCVIVILVYIVLITDAFISMG